jgi:flagellum-specific ATP synthase
MAAYREKEDLIAIGAYQRGTDPVTDAAIDLRGAIDAFLRQRAEEPSSLEDADRGLRELSAGAPDGAVATTPAPATAPVPATPAAAPASGGVPLHSAIPPLHLHA